jgi:hypothetical protein
VITSVVRAGIVFLAGFLRRWRFGLTGWLTERNLEIFFLIFLENLIQQFANFQPRVSKISSELFDQF